MCVRVRWVRRGVEAVGIAQIKAWGVLFFKIARRVEGIVSRVSRWKEREAARREGQDKG